MRISQDFERIDSSPFLDLRRCKRCAVAKPIKTVGQMASGFKKLRLEAEEKGASAKSAHVEDECPVSKHWNVEMSSDVTS